jgi:hypothetical protein
VVLQKYGKRWKVPGTFIRPRLETSTVHACELSIHLHHLKRHQAPDAVVEREVDIRESMYALNPLVEKTWR